MMISNSEIVLRLIVAFAVGYVLGIERYLRKKPAGTGTHTIVCLASTLVTIISAYGFQEFTTINHINMDPSRLMVGILTGIGFIGAGIIWRENASRIQGITTAANIFLIASLGIAIGMGYYFITGLTVVLAIAAHELSLWQKNRYIIKQKILHEESKTEAESKPGETESGS